VGENRVEMAGSMATGVKKLVNSFPLDAPGKTPVVSWNLRTDADDNEQWGIVSPQPGLGGPGRQANRQTGFLVYT